MINRLFIFAVLVLSFNAQAKFELPDLTTPEKLRQFITQLETEAPWLRGSSRSIAERSPQLIARLQRNTVWQNLAEERGPLIDLFIDIVQPIEREVRQVKPDVLSVWTQEIGSVWSPEQIARELDWLIQHDSRALATGLINSLPAERRGEFFRQGTVGRQLNQLRLATELTDESLRRNFRSADFGLDPETVSRNRLLGLLDESLRREETLVRQLRSAWYFANQEKDLDFYGLEWATQKRFLFESLNIGDQNKRALGYLQKVIRAQFDESDYQIGRETVDSVVKTYRLVEMSPSLGASRGWLMQDCSMGAYGFAYSPLEHNYLVYDDKGDATGVVAATEVESNGSKVLYVHDFGGQRVTSEIALSVIHGLYRAISQLGFQHLTVSARNGNHGAWPQVWTQFANVNDFIQQQYRDGELRSIIRTETAYSYDYDMPTAHITGPVFRPIAHILNTVRTRIVRHEDSPTESVRSTPASLSQALAIFNANPDAGITNDMLKIEGVRAQDILDIFRTLKNENRLALDQYYEQAAAMFEKFGIKASKNYFRENSHLFKDGHLNAQDAAATEDQALFNRTVSFVTQTLKAQKDTERSLELIRSHKDRFLTNDRFKAYLNSFTGHGPREAAQIAQLMDLDLPLEHLSEDSSALKTFVGSDNRKIRYWALSHLPKSEFQNLPTETIRKIALDLALDHDDYPRLASKYMVHIRSYDPTVLQQLKETYDEEEEVDIVLRAAISMRFNRQLSSEALREAYEKARQSPHLDAESTAIAQALIESGSSCEIFL